MPKPKKEAQPQEKKEELSTNVEKTPKEQREELLAQLAQLEKDNPTPKTEDEKKSDLYRVVLRNKRKFKNSGLDAEITENVVIKQGVILATFNPGATPDEEATINEYRAGGEKSKKWIRAALRNFEEKERNFKFPELHEIESAKDVRDLFPWAPDPINNKLGDRHPDVYDYFEKNYPDVIPVRYASGRYEFYKAGLGELQYLERDNVSHSVDHVTKYEDYRPQEVDPYRPRDPKSGKLITPSK